MPRNPSRPRQQGVRTIALAAGLLGLLLSGPVRGQGSAPPAPSRSAAAPAAAGSTAPGTFSAEEDQRRAQLWAATARFVYADDAKLAKIRTQLDQTIDDGSLRTFSRSLDDAISIEKASVLGQTHVLKLQGIFKEVQAKKPATLPLLAQAIQQKLEANQDRMKDPARKQQLAALVGRLNQLATVVPPAGAAQTPATDPAAAASGPGAEALSQAAAADAGQPLSPPLAAAPAASTVPSAAPVSAASSSLPMFALVLSALSLLGVLYLFLTRNQSAAPMHHPEPEPNPAKRKAPEPQQLSPSQYEELKKLVQKEVATQLQGGRQPTNQTVQSGLASQKKPTSRPAAPAEPAPQTVAAAPAAVVAPPAPPPQQPPSLDELMAVAVPTPPAPRHRTIYVNQQPLDGAFRRDNLADAPASYTIFEITVDEQQDSNHGTFVITRNEGSHGGYIGSHHSILDPAAAYSYPQGAVSRIITDTPGSVQKTPNGDWQIMQKARIHFT